MRERFRPSFAGTILTVLAVAIILSLPFLVVPPGVVMLDEASPSEDETRWPLEIRYAVRVADTDLGPEIYHDAAMIFRAESPWHWTLERHPAHGDEFECFEQEGETARDYGISADGCVGHVVSEWRVDFDEDGNPVKENLDPTITFDAEKRIREHETSRSATVPDIAFERSVGGRLRIYLAHGICDYGSCGEPSRPAGDVGVQARDHWVFDSRLNLPVARQVYVDGDLVFEVRAVSIREG